MRTISNFKNYKIDEEGLETATVDITTETTKYFFFKEVSVEREVQVFSLMGRVDWRWSSDGRANRKLYTLAKNHIALQELKGNE